MSDAVDSLTQKVNTLNAAVSKVQTTSNSAFGSVLNGVAAQGGALQLGQGNTNMMSTSLGHFSTPTPTNTSMGGTTGGGAQPPAPPAPPAGGAAPSGGGGGNIMTGALAKVGGIDPSTMAAGAGLAQIGVGALQIGLAPVAGAYAAAMPTGQIVNYATSYYQAARFGGISRSALESQTLAAMRGGITGVGSDAVTGNILANAGFMPGTSQYTMAAQQTALAARNYGMENAAAANSITSLSNMNIANNLFNMGIPTLDASGNQRTPGDITRDLLGRLYPQGVNATQLNRSIQYGSFQGQLAQIGITDPNTVGYFKNMAMDIAQGRNPNAANAQAGNQNPLNAVFQMNQSQTGVMQASEANALSGLQTAADLVTKFNDAMKPIIVDMAKYRAIIEGGLSTNAGQGVKSFASSLFSGVKNVLSGVGTLALGAAILGGGNPGYGGTFGGGRGNRGGGTPGLGGASAASNSLVSAGYGEKDTSGIWSSTGNTHKGVDYAVPTGTEVHATKEGIVSGKTLSSDYGQAVVLAHADGYSTIYAHLSNKSVSIGSKVKAGDVIGKTGASGNVTGPSLHYEVWKGDNNPVDPASLQGAFNSPISMGGLADVGTKPTNTTRAINPNAGTAGDQEFAKALLNKAGIKVTSANLTALTTWMHWEGGTKNNAYNPLNTTYDMPGAGRFNKEGVKSYNSLQQGVEATYGTLTGKDANKRGYTKILSDLKNNSPLDQVVTDINHSSWGTHIHGGGTVGFGSNLPSSTAGGGTINNVTIHLSIADASDSQAQLFAKKVKDILANDNTVLTMGSH